MMGKPVRREGKLFHVGFDLDSRVPADHPLRRIDSVIDFSFVRPLVASRYGHNGHVSVDPALLLRLLFLCFHENVRSERELMHQLPMRLDWLWFCGLDLDDAVPDHSVLSKVRRRWGEEVFEQVFTRVLDSCRQAGLISGRTMHADSTLLKANASLEGRISRTLWRQLEQSSALAKKQQDPSGPDADGGEPASTPEVTAPSPANPLSPPTKLNQWLVSPVDPDAATSTRTKGGTTLGYRDHRLIDDQCGIIVATLATPADRDDGAMLPELLEHHEDYLGVLPAEVVGDSMYGTRENYALLEAQGVRAYLKKRKGKDSPKVSWLKLLAAGCTAGRARYLLGRRKSRAEGSFAEAHVRMNHRRCRWRRRQQVQMQCYLVAMVQNLKKLARTILESSPLPLAMAA